MDKTQGGWDFSSYPFERLREDDGVSPPGTWLGFKVVDAPPPKDEP